MKQTRLFFRLFAWSLALMLCLPNIHARAQDSLGYKYGCGTNASYILKGATSIDTTVSYGGAPTRVMPFSSSAIMTCGKIAFYLEDVNRSFNTGFDDPTPVGSTTLGAQRRNTLCEVASYIQSIIDFSYVSDTDPVRIYVDTSFAPVVHPFDYISNIFAQAAPYYDTSHDGITNGFINQYVTSGIDPVPGKYHGMAQVNFDKFYIRTTGGAMFDEFDVPWQNNCDTPFTPATSCQKADLFSVLLHEVTHSLGWISYIHFNSASSTGHIPQRSITNHVIYSGLDTSLRVSGNTYPLVLTKVLTGPPSATVLDSTNPAFRDSFNYWMNNNPAPYNDPVYSGAYSGGAVPSYLSHMDDATFSYTFRQRISPGDQDAYVMGPFFNLGALRRNYSKGEIRDLVTVLGYRLTDSFTIKHPNTFPNHRPFSKKMANYSMNLGNYSVFSELVTPDFTMTNDSGSSMVVSSIPAMIASGDVSDADAGDSIYIDSTTLVNFRGCGSGGNNHVLLKISADSKTITYTPRHNFYGKAQFGYNITDGKERGSFVVVTVEVLKGTNVKTPVTTNLILNPGFEEGSEIRMEYTDEGKMYSYSRESGNHEGKWQGICFSDSHPYDFASDVANLTFDGNSGIVSRNSCFGSSVPASYYGVVATTCGILDTSTMQDGNVFQTFPRYTEGPTFDTALGRWVGGSVLDNPESSDGTGNRYQMFSTPGRAYYYLGDSLRHCHRYTLEFDAYRPITMSWSSLPFTIGFADHLVNLFTTLYPDTSFNYSVVNSISDTTPFYLFHGWRHYSIPIWYCGTAPSNILYLSTLVNSTTVIHLDNLSLKEDTTAPPPLLAAITKTQVSFCTTQLSTVVTNGSCALTYLWAGGDATGVTTATVNVVPTTSTNYTVTVTDAGCRSATATATTNVTPAPIPPIRGYRPICSGHEITLTDSVTGGVWTSSNPLRAVIDSSTGVFFAEGAGTMTITYTVCGRYITTLLTVNPSPAAISIIPVCQGAQVYANDASTGGRWSIISGGSHASIVDSTGLVTGISGGSYTIEYTLPGLGCVTEQTATVYATPHPITGPSSVCQGYSITLSDVDTGFVWISENINATITTAGVMTGRRVGLDTIEYVNSSDFLCHADYPVTINASPGAITGLASVCAGSAITLSDTTAVGVWSISPTAIATIVPGTGFVTGVSRGTATVTFTKPDGCFANATVVVNPLPGAIHGLLNVCIGMTTALTDTVGGGGWSSSNPLVATVMPTSGIVRGVASGTATISYILPSGCYSTVIVTVSAVPASITGSTHVCVGSMVTLSDTTGGGSWSSASTAIATVVTGTGMVTGVSAGTTTIDYTSDECAVTITLFVDPLPAAISGPTSLCAGSTYLFTDASGGGTWSSDNVTVASIDGSGNVTGVSAGTANIIYTSIATGCSVSVMVTVHPSPGPITGYPVICGPGGTTILSDGPAGGDFRSSNDSIATVGLVGSTPGVVTGHEPGTDTIFYILGGCSSYVVVTVYPLSTDSCLPCHYFSGGFMPIGGGSITGYFGPGNYYIANDVTITGTTDFTSCVVLVAPGVHIYVASTASLTLSGSHFFSCNGMWQGFILQSDTASSAAMVIGADSTFHSSLIEDAIIGIDAENLRNPTGGAANFIASYNTIFNRNDTAVKIANYIPIAPAVYPFHFENTIFTSRDLSSYTGGSYPLAWPNTANFRTASGGLSPYMSPYNFYIYQGAKPKVHPAALQTVGIYLNSVGAGMPYASVVIGAPSTDEVVALGAIGNSKINIFDTLTFGIRAVSSNFTVHNNVFSHMTLQPAGGNPSPDNGGVGIYATNNYGGMYQFTVEPSTDSYSVLGYTGTVTSTNYFYNCPYGVYATDYYHMTGNSAQMITTQSSTAGNSGFYGYDLRSSWYDTVNLNYNAITNVANGIAFTSTFAAGHLVHAGGGVSYWTLGYQIDGSINANHNDIQAALGTATPTTQYVSFGIAIQNVVNNYGLSLTSGISAAGTVNTSYNKIRDAYRGILVGSYWMQQAISGYNNITVKKDPVKSISYGVNHTDCSKSFIYENLVVGSNDSAMSDSVRAYYAASDANITVSCNKADSTGRGFEFFLNNPGTAWHDNQMTKHREGYLLNGGFIGQQGDSTRSCNNVWLNHAWWSTANSQTYVMNGADPLSSKLYILTANIPIFNGGYPTPYLTRTGSLYAVPGRAYAFGCPAVPVGNTTHASFERIARNNIPYTSDTAQNSWLAQFGAWLSVTNDTALMDSSAVLQSFDSLAATCRYAELSSIENALAFGDTATAGSLLRIALPPLVGRGPNTDSLTGVIITDDSLADFIVDNYKDFYTLYLHYISGSMVGSDSVQVAAIAS